ncbi:hypothetical protein BH23BAC4_BH23BAC4_11010 [soil metagenome]
MRLKYAKAALGRPSLVYHPPMARLCNSDAGYEGVPLIGTEFDKRPPSPPSSPTMPQHMAFLSVSQPYSDPLVLAERALRNPTSTIWLDGICLATGRFEESLAFYVGTLGLALRTIESDPARPGQLRALLIDAEGRDVLEICEDTPGDAGRRSLARISFSLPQRSWHALRTRLSARQVPHEERGGRLMIVDADGTQVQITSLA